MIQRLRPHGDALLVLLLPVIGFHWKILLLGQVICGGDFINQFVPWREFALREFAQGRFPAWNPYVFCGTPFAANIQTALFYPLNLLHLLFSVEYSFSLDLVFHHALSLLSMYFFLYRSGLSKGGSVVGALLYGWSGFFITHAHDGHLIHLRAYAWIPLALYYQSLLFSQVAFRRLFLLSLVLALLFLAGHTQIPLYIFYLLLARAVWHGGYIFYRTRAGIPFFTNLTVTLGAIGFSFGLAALALLPLAQLSQYTAGRSGGASYEFAVSDSLPPSHLITFLAPFFYGDPTQTEAQDPDRFWETGTGYHEICGYIGVFSLLLLFLAFLPKPSVGEIIPASFQPDLLFFTWLLLAGLFFSLGQYNPLYPLLYYGLPGWSYFRVPGRLALYFILGAAFAAGRGSDLYFRLSWSEIKASKAFKTAAVASSFLLVLLLILLLSRNSLISLLREMEVNRAVGSLGITRVQAYQALPPNHELFTVRFGWMSSSLALGVLITALGWIALLWGRRWMDSRKWMPLAGVLLLDLLLFSGRFIATRPLSEWRETYFPQTNLITFLQQNADGSRVMCLDDAIGHPGLLHHPELRPNRLMHYGIQSVRGYDPIILSAYTRFVNRLYGQPEDTPQGGLLFFPYPPVSEDMKYLNAAFIVTTQNLESPFEMVYSEPESPIKVYKNPLLLPRVSMDGKPIRLRSTQPSAIWLQTDDIASDSKHPIFFSQVHYPGWLYLDRTGQTHPSRTIGEIEDKPATNPFIAAPHSNVDAFRFHSTAHILGAVISLVCLLVGTLLSLWNKGELEIKSH